MISIPEALATVLGAVRLRPAEQVGLSDALGRVLAADVMVPFDVPPFANSQMDGFAVRTADLAGASASAPRRLRVRGALAAGSSTAEPVGAGEALRIMTGAPIPPGSDAVVRLEDTRPGPDSATVEVLHAPAVDEFIRPAGEDLRKGERVLESGRILGPADLGLLASMGRPSVEVRVAPRVAILSTGDEIMPLGSPLGPGQIYNSNAYALAAAVRMAGGVPVVAPIVRDRPSLVREAFLGAAESDVVLSTGGVSVGDHDHVRPIMAEIGLEQRFWRVAQKPGKPIAFAQAGARLYFGLPGNPVSSLVCFFLYVAPALRRSLGRRDVFPARTEVTMATTVATARDLTELVRCRLRRDGEVTMAEPTGTQSSGALRSLALADALVLSLPGVDRLREGERYPALLLDATAEADPFA